MATSDEVAYCPLCPVYAVAEHGISTDSRNLTVNDDKRYMINAQGVKTRLGPVARRDYGHPIDSVGNQHLNAFAFFLKILVSIAEEKSKPSARGNILDSPRDSGEKRIGYVRQDQAECSPSAKYKRPSNVIRNVVKISDRA